MLGFVSIDFFFTDLSVQCNKKQSDNGADSHQEGDEVNGQVKCVCSPVS